MAADAFIGRLPVPVSQDLLDEHPNFAILLNELSRSHIHPSGTSGIMQKTLEEQRSRTAVETRSLYENQALWCELQEMCYAPPKAAPPTVLSALTLLDKHMSLASLISSSAPQLLFGVEQSTVADVLGPAKTRAEQAAQIQTLLLPLLTNRLKARLQAVASFFDASYEGDTSLESFINAVKDVQAKVRQMEQEASASKARALRTAFEYQKVTLKALALVQELIQKHRLQSIHKANVTHCQWLQDREVAMEMKLGLLKNELLCDTYTPEAIAALRVIRDQLHLVHCEGLQENERADSKLRQYAAAGPAIERLAKEHARLLAETKDREWALAKMSGTA